MYCVYVCMHVHCSDLVYIPTYEYMCTCVHVYISVHMCTLIYISVHVCTHIHMCYCESFCELCTCLHLISSVPRVHVY